MIWSRSSFGTSSGTPRVHLSGDEEPLNAADPVKADGQVRFDALKVQARHVAIVKNILKEGSFGLVILGGDHDLSENVRRLGEGKCEYVRVTTKCFREAART